MAETRRKCELCNDQASIYCPSDSAFLCRSCDAKVHSASFLVARHLRSSLCSNCCNLEESRRFSGSCVPLSATANLCRSCSPEKDIVSRSFSCISTTTDAGEEARASSSPEKRRVRKEKLEGGASMESVFVNWCRRMAVDDRRVVPIAMEIIAGCGSGMTILPFRVSITASFWTAMRISRGATTCQDLRRLEQISGVPAKLVLALETRIARVLKRRSSRGSHEEGWAEC